MYRGIRPFKFIYGKNVNSGSYNWTIQFKMEENEGVGFFLNGVSVDCSVVWTWIDVFSIDELEGSYSPVHGDHDLWHWPQSKVKEKSGSRWIFMDRWYQIYDFPASLKLCSQLKCNLMLAMNPTCQSKLKRQYLYSFAYMNFSQSVVRRTVSNAYAPTVQIYTSI